uniref:Uncharacterized protein n=1 Tax=Anguilla anguilla TaxID=7936 RepID=A0A0E9WJC2_ANGAN
MGLNSEVQLQAVPDGKRLTCSERTAFRQLEMIDIQNAMHCPHQCPQRTAFQRCKL